jgi:arylsulfatase A-like enzyme
MKRAILYIAAAVPATFIVLIAGYLAFVFPDDRKVPDLPTIGAEPESQEFIGSVLKSGLTHSIDIEQDAYRELRADIDRIAATGVVSESIRFVSPYQVLAPNGRYPWRLEAWDGLAVPDGRTLTVVVPPGAESVELAIRDGSAGVVIVKGASDPVVAATTAWSEGKWYPAALDRNVKKYMYLDRYVSMPRWRQLRTLVTSGSFVSVQCQSANGWCVVSDPTFYRVRPERMPRQTIMVLVDTLRADALRQDVMPSATDLANAAIHFRQAIAPGNMTSPSTNSILACRPPTQLGKVAFAYSIDRESREAFYRDRQPSFPAMLQSAGVRTAMIGNISVISEVFGVGVSHGFDVQLLTEPEGYESALAVSEAVRWVRENRSKDFFLYVHLNNPHAPYRPPLHYLISQFQGWSDLRTYPQVVKWLYRGEAAYADHQIGRLLAYLREEGLERQVNVVLTSDHGDQHRERRFSGNEIAQDFTGVYFDHGATLLNDEIHVPLVVRKAGEPARLIDNYVSTLWLGRTILDFFGMPAEISRRCVGRHLTADSSGDDPFIGSEGFQARALIADGRHKYIKTYEPTEKRVYSSGEYAGIRKSYLRNEQLFDLAVDPDEMNDLVQSDPDLLATMRQRFRSYFGISASYQLVLEGKGRSRFDIQTKDAEAVFDLPAGDGITKSRDGISGYFDETLRLKIKYAKGMKIPEIRINDGLVSTRATTLKLPWPEGPVDLPEESLDWMRTTGGPSATLVLVREDQRRDRQISLGNPAFEKVLREWGYLNEN